MADHLRMQMAAEELLHLRRLRESLTGSLASGLGGHTERRALHCLDKAEQVLVRILLAAGPEVLDDGAHVAHEHARRERFLRPLEVVALAHMTLELAVDAEAARGAAARVGALEAHVDERRRVREALQRRVYEARVAQVG